MSLSPEQKEAVRVLYEAASQLLSYAANDEIQCSRELCQIKVQECTKLAEEIAKMGRITIHVDGGSISQVDGIPFDLSYAVDTLNSASQETEEPDENP